MRAGLLITAQFRWLIYGDNCPADEAGRILCLLQRIKLTMDALGTHAEEGRTWWRYAPGRSHDPVIRRFPNGETPLSQDRDYAVKTVRTLFIKYFQILQISK